MKLLQPIIDKPQYSKEIEAKINEFFKQIFYAPIAKILKENLNRKLVINAAIGPLSEDTPLRQAILMGTVQYNDGRFTGQFTSAVSRELRRLGANYRAKTQAFHLPVDKVPVDIRMAAGMAADKFKKAFDYIKAYLDNINIDQMIKDFTVKTAYESTINDLDKQFKQTVKTGFNPPILTQEMKSKISQEYSENLKLYIKGWTEENILKLRQEVDKNSSEGYRSSNLEKILQENYGISKTKAKFLARQETSLFVSTFRENRYKDAGITQYRWRTAGDSRVRDRHAELDGKIFSFDDPPITDNKGNRNNPGMDFGCRCIALPVIN